MIPVRIQQSIFYHMEVQHSLHVFDVDETPSPCATQWVAWFHGQIAEST